MDYYMQTRPDKELIQAVADLLAAAKETRAEPAVCGFVTWLCAPQVLNTDAPN